MTAGQASASTQICISLWSGSLGRFHMGNLQLATHNTHFLQAAENLFRHALGKIDEAVILVNIDVSDVAPLEAGLIRNRADNISGLHTVSVSDFDTVRLEGNVAWRAARLARGTLVAGATVWTVCALGARRTRRVPAKGTSVRCVIRTVRTIVATCCARVSAVCNAFRAVLSSWSTIRGITIRPSVLLRLRRKFVTTRLRPRMSA